LTPDDAVIHFNLGAALCAAGEQRFEEAEGALTEAVRLGSESADAHRYLADVRQVLGRVPETDAQALGSTAAVPPRVTGPQPTPTAGGLADDLATVAFWYASAGLAEVPLLGSAAPEGLPEDLAKLRARLLELSAHDILPAASEEADSGTLLEAELQKLTDHDRAIEIFRRRTFADEPETLDLIGKSWGMTRERVRQLEHRARTELRGALVANAALAATAATAREVIGAVLPLSDLLRLLPALAEEVGAVGQPVWRVLAALDGGYEIDDGWCATPTVKDAKTATGAWLQSYADSHGAARLSGFTLLSASQHVDRPEQATRDWLAYCGFAVHADWVFTKTATSGERAAALLSAVGAPLSAQEILDHEPEGRSLTALRNSLALDDRFSRVDRDAWALSEWGLDAYSTIKDQIHQELAGSGGQVPIDALIERITGKYSVASSSVRAYASAPPFESGGGVVRFATAERASTKALTSTRRLYQGEDSWLYRVQVTGEHVRGSGSVAPVALAAKTGLQRGSHYRLSSRLGPQLFSWASLQPAFGTIQRFLAERNIAAGQQVFLVVGSDLSFDIRPVVLDQEDPLAAALSLAGCADLAAADPWPALARAMDLPEDSPIPDVIAGYHDRGDTDIANLLRAVWP
jgi:Sigma-70, region 4